MSANGNGDRPIALSAIQPSSLKRPKGFGPYAPKNKSLQTVERILDLFERMRDADALPLGPRTVGYRLKEIYPGEYTKKNFDALGEILKRLAQAQRIPFQWTADGSGVTYDAGGWPNPDAFMEDAPDLYNRDRRAQQPVVLEIYAEARETLPLIRRLAWERGVSVYSGSGSNGPNLARKVADRALVRAVEHEQSTLILGIADFDTAGIRNVMRPHLEHVAGFLYGNESSDAVLAVDGKTMIDTDAGVSFRHLALTPEMAGEIVESDADRRRIEAYIASGADVWSRDLAHIEDVQKIETEALDPVELRRVVVDAIDATIDGAALERVTADEKAERQNVAEFCATWEAS